MTGDYCTLMNVNTDETDVLHNNKFPFLNARTNAPRGDPLRTERPCRAPQVCHVRPPKVLQGPACAPYSGVGRCVHDTHAHAPPPPTPQMCKCKTGCANGHCSCEREGNGCNAACGCTGCANPHGAHTERRSAAAHGGDDAVDHLTNAMRHAAIGKRHAAVDEIVHDEHKVTVMHRGHKLTLGELKAIKGVFYVGSSMRDDVAGEEDEGSRAPMEHLKARAKEHSKDKYGELDFFRTRNMKQLETELIEWFQSEGCKLLNVQEKSNAHHSDGYVYVIHNGGSKDALIDQLRQANARSGH